MIEAPGRVLPRIPVGAIACVLLTLGVQARPQDEQRPTSNTVRCLLTAENRTWKKGEPAGVTVKLENLTDGGLNLKIIPEFFLNGDEEYSAPTDVVHDKPIDVEKVPIKGGKVVGIRPVSLKVRLNARSTSIFEVDLAKTKWARTISSVWPSRPLSALPSGQYLLRLEFTDSHGRSVKSNGITVILQN